MFVGGICMTLLWQSSSLSTTAIIGLVASGALPLPAAIGAVLGANIGTTGTIWLAGILVSDGMPVGIVSLEEAPAAPVIPVEEPVHAEEPVAVPIEEPALVEESVPEELSEPIEDESEVPDPEEAPAAESSDEEEEEEGDEEDEEE